MSELKRCPFCGGIGQMNRIFMTGTAITCKSCGGSSSLQSTYEKAVEAWNTRKPLERIVERLEEQSGFYGYYGYEEGKYVKLHDAIEIVKEEGGL